MPGFLLKQSGSIYGSGTPGGTESGVIQRIQSVAPSNLIGLWPQNETSGTTVNCVNNPTLSRVGGYVGVTLGQPGPYGIVCPLYDGINDAASLFTAALAALFNGPAGTIPIIAKVFNAGVWSDSTIRYMVRIASDASNVISIYKPAAANNIIYSYVAGGVTKTVTASVSDLDFMLIVLTWNKANDAVIAYFDNGQVGLTQTGLGNWAGAIVGAVVGASTLPAANPWYGWLSCPALFNRALTLAEIQYIYAGGPG